MKMHIHNPKAMRVGESYCGIFPTFRYTTAIRDRVTCANCKRHAGIPKPPPPHPVGFVSNIGTQLADSHARNGFESDFGPAPTTCTAPTPTETQ